jgi:hypothetical protein
MDRFGWDKSQVLLKPVIRALEERVGSRHARLVDIHQQESGGGHQAIRRSLSLLVVNNLKLWFAFQVLNILCV